MTRDTRRAWSQRTASLGQSDIRAMTQACVQIKGINMAQGVCDTGVPPVVAHAVQHAVDLGYNIYTRFDGLPQLRQALARKTAHYNGFSPDPETDITVSAGATGAFHCACMALFDPGDEVIVFEPYYAYHLHALASVDAVPRIVPTLPPDWAFDLRALEEAVTARTKAIVVNTPSNPSGKVFSRAELEQIGRIAMERDLFVITDEIYEYFLYDGRPHVSLASLPGMAERTITISGYSKTFAITGWRIGHTIAAPRWAQAIGSMNDLLYVCAPAPLQHAVATGINELRQEFYVELATEYQAKRDRFCEALQRAGLPPSVPQGAYYVLADVSLIPGKTGKERAMYVLEKTGVAGVPGEAFFQGETGHRFIRFCYAKTEKDLADACDRLARLT
ncbi:Aminotransferase [Nitrospira tepida]|uniref:Aminotransferase n=1 Tax=Nitrospira tepida TaxID=2973512 RepID=A0AA86MYL9_9BACT|nr:pyridoxal phosphate-dependent aminotransferase [Nitrospira tepida]CAI4031458.1 Aminotransferase [Nitrospira tepida]